MFVGHYGASLVAKHLAPRLPLLLAAQAVDAAWATFVVTGVEHVRIVPGHSATNPLDLYDMPYAYSLPAALLRSLAAARLTYARARRSEPSAVRTKTGRGVEHGGVLAPGARPGRARARPSSTAALGITAPAAYLLVAVIAGWLERRAARLAR